LLSLCKLDVILNCYQKVLPLFIIVPQSKNGVKSWQNDLVHLFTRKHTQCQMHFVTIRERMLPFRSFCNVLKWSPGFFPIWSSNVFAPSFPVSYFHCIHLPLSCCLAIKLPFCDTASNAFHVKVNWSAYACVKSCVEALHMGHMRGT